MKIHVNRIPAEGLRSHATYDPSTMDMDRSDVRLSEPFEVDAFMTKADQELVVDVDIRCPLRLSCARCLEGFSWVVATDALFSYTVQPTDVVDITDDVRQEIVLAYPMTPLCRPDCKGLCSSCGQNLNIAPCSHQATETHRRDDWPRDSSIAL
jgi:uncharacterized protein